MKLLEERFGSLVAVDDQLRLLIKGEHLTPYDAMLTILPLGLLHEDQIQQAIDGEPPMRFAEFKAALVDAINESFPDPAGKEDEGDQGEASPGATSITSPPSDSAAAMASSGA